MIEYVLAKKKCSSVDERLFSELCIVLWKRRSSKNLLLVPSTMLSCMIKPRIL